MTRRIVPVPPSRDPFTEREEIPAWRARKRVGPLRDLVHRPENGKREPLEVGCWAVYEDRRYGIGADWRLALPLQLVRVTGGPHYEADEGGSAATEWWDLDVFPRSQRWSLTRLDPTEALAQARETIDKVNAFECGKHVDEAIIRIARIAELGRLYIARLGSMFPVDRADLVIEALDAASEISAIVTLDDEIRTAITRRRWLLEFALPSFARNLYIACALTLAASGARFETWPPRENT